MKKNPKLQQVADLFHALATASPDERAALKRGITDSEWQDMESMANFAAMFVGVESDVTLDRGEVSELIRSMINLQDRALETVFADVRAV